MIRSHENKFRMGTRPPRNFFYEPERRYKNHPFTVEEEYERNLKAVDVKSDFARLSSGFKRFR